MKFLNFFPKFQNTSYSWQLPHCRKIYKFGCPSQESLPKFKEHLFLMIAFKVYHMCRKHGEGSSKIGGSFSQCMGEYGEKDSLQKEKEGIWGDGLPRKRKISS